MYLYLSLFIDIYLYLNIISGMHCAYMSPERVFCSRVVTCLPRTTVGCLQLVVGVSLSRFLLATPGRCNNGTANHQVLLPFVDDVGENEMNVYILEELVGPNVAASFISCTSEWQVGEWLG